MLGLRAEAVLRNEHEGGKENRFQGYDHGEKAVGKGVEGAHAGAPGVQKNPNAKPHDMQVDEYHASRKRSDGIGNTVLPASCPSSFQAKLDQGANVSLNDLGQRRVILVVVYR